MRQLSKQNSSTRKLMEQKMKRNVEARRVWPFITRATRLIPQDTKCQHRDVPKRHFQTSRSSRNPAANSLVTLLVWLRPQPAAEATEGVNTAHSRPVST
ncbi:hypothetical protein BaRGS_00004277 [Batillaria attramentaria]|uniref:Uncharacterized protein n=1 Tax=Batillaria attramentaria TaxID=370345 RepID=A0ABD0LYW7_9CAEN